MMFRLPLLTKLAGAGVAGILLAGGAATQVAQVAQVAPVAGTVLTAASPANPAASSPARRNGLRVRLLVFRSEAAVLKLTPRQLRQDVRGGTSVEELAAKAGLDKAQFTAAVVADLQPRLARWVKAGRLTQAQADAVVNRVQKGWLPFWTLKK